MLLMRGFAKNMSLNTPISTLAETPSDRLLHSSSYSQFSKKITFRLILQN